MLDSQLKIKHLNMTLQLQQKKVAVADPANVTADDLDKIKEKLRN